MVVLSKDELWKGAIEELVQPFLHFFFPQYVNQIDWSKPIDFMDTELPKIIRGLRKGKRTADRLIKVILKNGLDKYFFIHVEVQSQIDKDFPKRMYKMYYRISDKEEVDVTSLAILAYKGARESGIYKHSFWGTEIEFKFNVFNLIHQVEKGKLDNENIFSVIIKSVYIDLKYEIDDIEKYKLKIKLIEEFLKRKPNEEEYQCLMNFIIMFIRLNAEMTQEVEKYINNKLKISNTMKIADYIKLKLEKEVIRRDKIIAKKEEALLEKEEALSEKEKALKKEIQLRIIEKENDVERAYKNGIDISMISNITDLDKRSVRAILKKKKLI